MTDREFTRRLLQTVVTVTAVGILLVALYAARAALMLIYISALIAMGFAPLVNLLQRRRTDGRNGVSRTFAILTIYLVILLVIALLALAVVAPPV
jgi:predicted PurR-regulated permease PerM